MDAARKRIEDVLSKDKANVSAMIDLANLSAMAGKEAEYVSWLEKATKADPSAIPPYRLLTRYYQQKQDGAKALATAKQARGSDLQDIEALEPDIRDSQASLGAVDMQAGHYDQALATAQRFEKLDPALGAKLEGDIL